MLRETDSIRVRHMLDSAKEAVEFAAERKRKDLNTDRQLTHSLVHCIEIIGEAASKVSPECRSSHPEIPWSSIVGMRNRLIHVYFDINLSILWRTVKEELPLLITSLEKIIEGRSRATEDKSNNENAQSAGDG